MTTEIGHVEPVRVNFDDLDAMGVLHNSRYGVLFERALAAYWERRGWAFDPKQPHFADIFFVVREFSITYRVPITSVGEVGVHFWFDDIGITSGVYGFRILSADGAVVHAEGRRAQVKLDPATLRPSPIPADVLEACRPLFGPALNVAALSGVADAGKEMGKERCSPDGERDWFARRDTPGIAFS